MPPKSDPSFIEIDKNYSKNNRIKVCVIGAGAAGLVNARLYKSRPDIFDVTVFEKGNEVGGTWVYNEKTGVHSSMYKSLKTNLPLSIMQFSDYACDIDKQGFVSHEDVLQYLKGYCCHFNLRPLIHFHHEVLNVKRMAKSASSSREWLVKVRDILTNQSREEYFDSVLVCNGRYSKPKIPVVKGVKLFNGKVRHVHDYRTPDEYAGQRIAVLGAGPSGTDISLELASVADEVFLCHNLPELYPNMPNNITQISSSIASLDGNRVIMKTGQVLDDIDTVFFATGYDFDFGFLDKSCGIELAEEGGRVKDLYLHLVNAKYPSMAIWAVTCKVIPFPFYEIQAAFFMKVMMGEVVLPSRQEMIQETEEDFDLRLSMGIPARHAHEMATKQLLWSYEERLVSTAKIQGIKPVFRDLYTQLFQIRQEHTAEYKNWDFVIVNDYEFHCIKK